jgi:hypothetical protein
MTKDHAIEALHRQVFIDIYAQLTNFVSMVPPHRIVWHKTYLGKYYYNL